MLNPETTRETPDSILNWAPDAPKGGKAVMNRVLKDGASVPLFFAQTFIASLRDVGYNTTTSAICEHVDNAIQAGAREVRVYFRQAGKQSDATSSTPQSTTMAAECRPTCSRSQLRSAAP